jgi:hypothetical protein
LRVFLPALSPMQAGDVLTIRPGWDKSFAFCKTGRQRCQLFAACRTSPRQRPAAQRYPDA